MIKQVHSDIEVEPHLRPISGKNINGLAGDDARPDIRARSVWQNGQNTFSDIRVANTKQTFRIIYHQPKFLGDMRKKEIASTITMHGIFTPLVFSVSGSVSKECSMFHEHMTQKITITTGEDSSLDVHYCFLSMILFHGSRSMQKFELADDFLVVYDYSKFFE